MKISRKNKSGLLYMKERIGMILTLRVFLLIKGIHFIVLSFKLQDPKVHLKYDSNKYLIRPSVMITYLKWGIPNLDSCRSFLFYHPGRCGHAPCYNRLDEQLSCYHSSIIPSLSNYWQLFCFQGCQVLEIQNELDMTLYLQDESSGGNNNTTYNYMAA